MVCYLKKWKEFINESKDEYLEIEFVCHNSLFPDSTDKYKQRELYDYLKILKEESDFALLPYMQDFSDDDHTEISLAVIILDKSKNKFWKKEIEDVARKFGVKIDLYNKVHNSTIDAIIRRRYPYLIE